MILTRQQTKAPKFIRTSELITKLLPNSLLARLGVGGDITKFAFKSDSGVKKDIETKYRFEGDLLEIFAGIDGSIVHKWHHYIPIYDRYFSKYRDKNIRFLEIGVSQGGSLKMWRKYFGEHAIIYGVDINPDCLKFDGIDAKVRIGSQTDKQFLESVIREMGGIDVILDDGSHQMRHISKSFSFLFQKLNDGGLYMIEDLHTAYWRSFGGGYRSKSNFFNFISEIIDDMHRWYHLGGINHRSVSENCSAVHIHDSIAIFEKGYVYKPCHSRVG